ncbi:MAG: phosphoribosyltransferase [Burkholderiales bacterium]|nr:phosphoribosyltransferase [Burkholderiales bacterium]
MMFADRAVASRKLAVALARFRSEHPLVLGIPRGGVPMARIIADELDCDIDVVLVRKLRAPANSEYAIGAVDESGWSFVTSEAAWVRPSPEYLEEEKRAQLEVILERRHAYTALRPPIDPKGRVVIVVDDGLATGSTMMAALHALAAKHPARLVCAVPVAPPDTAVKIKAYCDEVVCLETPRDFSAVGQFYRSFPQTTDEEVVAALQR